MTDHDLRPARARDLPLIAAIEDLGIGMFEAVLGDLTGDILATPGPSGQALTLTTYADLPWNGPFYARHGFVELAEDEPMTAAQLALSENEERIGLSRHGRRTWMRRALRSHRTADELTASPRDWSVTPGSPGAAGVRPTEPPIRTCSSTS